VTRRVPEFALVVGVFLAASVLLAGLLFADDATLTVLLAAAVGYPSVAYAVVHADDPTDVLPPRAVLVVGVLLAATGALVVGLTARVALPGRAFLALLVGLVLGLPAAAYRVRYGTATGPAPGVVAAGAILGGTGVLLAGLLVRAPVYATAAGLVVGLAGGLYASARGYRASHRARRRSLLAGLGVGTLLVGVGVATGVPLASALAVGVAATLGPAVYHALASDAAA
jgi:hypothetical protein